MPMTETAYLRLALAQINPTVGDIEGNVLLVSESIVVLFVLIRRPTTTISRRGFDWLSGFAGTLAPLLVIPAERTPMVPIGVRGWDLRRWQRAGAAF